MTSSRNTVFLLLCLPVLSRAQVDTTLILPLVEIATTPPRTQSIGGHTQSWTTAELQPQRHNNLADWLSRAGGLFIKSYGSGSIATTSIRGGSAAHTSVLWNGLPIQSPMLGQLDFSLFPLAFADRIQLFYGGNSAAWGSGAIGGLISLDNTAPADSCTHISLRSSLGSFGFFDQQAQLSFSKGQWASQTRLFYRRADNDFSYRLRPDLPEKTQTHATLEQKGLLQSLYWQPTLRQQLTLHLWLQGADREIPPTTVQNQSQATQADEFMRSLLHWKLVAGQTIWQARLGFIRESIDYQDDLILLRALTRFRTMYGEVEGQWAWAGGARLHFGLNHNFITASADAYATDPQQNRTAAFLSYRYRWKIWLVQVNLRQEMVDNRLLSPVPGLGLDIQVHPQILAQFKISRNYRLPTLNDLYWQPGGNPELLPESGWSQEAGLQVQLPAGIGYQVTAFNRLINNWILWSKAPDQPFWSSNNIARVWSRGVEQRLQWHRTIKKWRLNLQAGYDYICSTNEIALDQPKLEKGSQLVYVPRHQAFASLSLHWGGLELQYRHTYTGRVSSLNSGELAAYQLGDTGLYYQLPGKKWPVQSFFQVNNLWDTNYRVIERQAMPGRHFQVGLQLEFRKTHPSPALDRQPTGPKAKIQ